MVFNKNDDFPSNRSELYRQALDILLKEWDTSWGIPRDEVYENLDLEGKKALLSHVAKVTFDENRYFLKQEEIEKYIADYLQTLPNAQTCRLQQDSEAVLKSIEAQHGLFIERADEIYSFSHLTFQEYFAAKWFCDRRDWEGLAKHVRYKHWQEVFLLVVELLTCADELLQRMKSEIDSLCCPELLIDHNLGQALYNAHVFIHIPPLVRDLDYFYVNRSFLLNFENIFKCKLEHKLQDRLQEIKAMLPEFIWANCENFKCWWQEDGRNWTQQLRELMIQYRDIKNDWQFDEAQKELLRQYYNASNLLRDCLNSGCAVSGGIRKEIENKLLFFVAEIE